MTNGSSTERIGPRRLVVGAHYGMSDWLAQRFTAVANAVYTIILLVAFLGGRNYSYDGWAGLYSHVWMKVATLIAIASVAFHAWVGIRDVWMDYVKPTGIRLLLQVGTIVWLFACVAYLVTILWKV